MVNPANLQLRLSWVDPSSGRQRRPRLFLPVALGKRFAAMPAALDQQPVSRMVINDDQAEDFQALIMGGEGEVYVVAMAGAIAVNQQQVEGEWRLAVGDRLGIGETEIEVEAIEVEAIEMEAIEVSQAERLTQGAGQDGIDSKIGDTTGGDFEPSIERGPTSDRPAHFTIPTPISPNRWIGAVHPGFGFKQTDPVQGSASPLATPGMPLEQGSPSPSSPLQPGPISLGPIPPAPSPRPAPAHPTLLGPGCRHSVGFLIQRQCGRSNSIGCPHCSQGKRSSLHPFAQDYDLYPGFGRYGPGDWGYGLLVEAGVVEAGPET